MAQPLPEVWLRGPVEGIPDPLQPVAHALLQAVEELEAAMVNFPDSLLWEKPAGTASVGFHLLHITGVLDRLCTYALSKPLTDDQLAYLQAETAPHQLTPYQLVQGVKGRVDAVLQQLKATTEAGLRESRAVGRKSLPSTVQGLLFHAAEHTMRHLGQLLVTATVVKYIAGNKK